MAWIYGMVTGVQAPMGVGAVDPRHAWMNAGDYGTMTGINPSIVPFPVQANATPMLLPLENLLYR
ncbi:hypothetical protein [Stenotrophomonas sp. NPDC077659]|uniref:hypothetical protein n=1 Tax=Stenotrophomonas sp. NPDC077659 TaxID=3390694 RepID=UPI003D06976E